jgi:DNA uptake protein ComE-like DNA-binding protein
MDARHTLPVFLGILASLTIATLIAVAQPAKPLLDPNSAPESELVALPHMTPAIVKGMVSGRPYKTVLDLNKYLLDQKLTGDQARDFYRAAFVKVNLNTGARAELLLIPGVGPRMASELAEYRPWKTWAQFDKEIGKYVGQQEVERLKLYVFIPPA